MSPLLGSSPFPQSTTNGQGYFLPSPTDFSFLICFHLDSRSDKLQIQSISFLLLTKWARCFLGLPMDERRLEIETFQRPDISAATHEP